MSRTIDMTPTFEQAARMCIMVLENGTAEGKKMAREELLRYCRQYDELVGQTEAEAFSKGHKEMMTVHAVMYGDDEPVALFKSDFEGKAYAQEHLGEGAAVLPWSVPAYVFKYEEA